MICSEINYSQKVELIYTLVISLSWSRLLTFFKHKVYTKSTRTPLPALPGVSQSITDFSLYFKLIEFSE